LSFSSNRANSLTAISSSGSSICVTPFTSSICSSPAPQYENSRLASLPF
jgi:trimethylamine:corrinoid methyltransferase-like protein